jgi:hypothetical protein
MYDRALAMKEAFATLIKRIRAEIKRHPKLRWLPPRSRRQKRAAMKSHGEPTANTRKEEFEYALVWELKGAQHLHAHVLMRAPYIPWGWLKWHWSQLGIGTHVHIKHARSSGWEARHASKQLGRPESIGPLRPSEYVTKSSSETAAAIAPLRLVQVSAGYAPTDEKPKDAVDRSGWTWIPLRENAAEAIATMLAQSLIHVTSIRSDGTYEIEVKAADVWELDLSIARRNPF